MMKAFILAFLLIVGSARAAESDYLAPRDVLESDGALTLTDGSSYFVFARDGVFHSFPVGISGRTFEGVWTVEKDNPCVFTVEAEQGWINGSHAGHQYRKIVFIVYGGRKRAVDHPTPGGMLPSPKEVWDGYFLIDEFVKISGITK